MTSNSSFSNGTSTSRRSFLRNFGAFAAAGCMCGRVHAQTVPGAAAPALAKPYRIDTHHHILPPAFLAEERARVLDSSQGINTDVIDGWTPQRALADMDKAGVQTSVVSISTPGVYYGDVGQGRRLARLCNDYGATLIRDYPGRFGMFAAIPLPDVEGSLREIEYALDVLKLDGIGLMTSYADRWPGDPAFFPVFQELNRRKAVVYFHPTAPNCCGSLVPDVSSALVEYPTDTTRCAASLAVNGTFSKCPDIKFIFSHGGGSLPTFAARLDRTFRNMPKAKENMPKGAMYEFQRQYYDVVAATNEITMAGVTKFVPPTQILLGSDFPYRPAKEATDGLRSLKLFSDSELMAIERDNAVRLIPRLAS
ncbi:amidohydrolase family protein [Bosea sp. BK604]|uniref:amidohydrolase family protein n=1 Tax=Bosea sp. BK604 TaxID=2512180 RepID=UPI0010D511AD|nr:amidohydrolase family protein [Bosea sp. BK604]TCR70438.1 putative TIM-barrel fold metal-dependent hydrolase [Bosea sp. BK604]